MGYLSNHTIQVIPNNKEVLSKLFDELNDDTGTFELDEDYITTEQITWYDSVFDLKDLSTKFPNIKISLAIVSEEGDKWFGIFLNGNIIEEYKDAEPSED